MWVSSFYRLFFSLFLRLPFPFLGPMECLCSLVAHDNVRHAALDDWQTVPSSTPPVVATFHGLVLGGRRFPRNKPMRRTSISSRRRNRCTAWNGKRMVRKTIGVGGGGGGGCGRKGRGEGAKILYQKLTCCHCCWLVSVLSKTAKKIAIEEPWKGIGSK